MKKQKNEIKRNNTMKRQMEYKCHRNQKRKKEGDEAEE